MTILSMTKFIENFTEWGEEFIKPFKEFLENNHGNPLLWVALLGAGVLLFGYTYNSLHKN